MSADIRIYRQREGSTIIAKTEKGIRWILDNVTTFEGEIKYSVPSDCVDEVAEAMVNASMIVEISS